MSLTNCNVSLLAFTPNPEELVCLAARRCRSNSPTLDIDTDGADQVIKKVLDAGHLSVLEHVCFTFAIDGISRVCLAQLTRHRIASFSVQSQRAVSVNDYVSPRGLVCLGVERNISCYNDAIDAGSELEDARYLLPQAVATSLVMTMNARALLLFFELRCCHKAQWEIRDLANQMLKLVKPVAPNIFKRAGAFCTQYGFCREPKTCGKMNVPHHDFLFDLLRFWEQNR